MSNKLKAIIGLVILVFIFGAISLTNKDKKLVKQNNKIEQKDKKVSQLKKNISSQKNELIDLTDKNNELNSELSNSKKASNDNLNTKKFFETILNYDTSSYLSRFEQAKKFGSDQAINIFKGTGGEPQKPKTSISSKMTNYKFLKGDNNTGIVQLELELDFQGQKQKNNFEYYITYDKSGFVKTCSVQRQIESVVS